MQKIIWCGMLGAIICAAVSYLAVGHLGCPCCPGVAEDREPKVVNTVCSPDEVRLLDALLPDPAKLLADWQTFETIDLLSPQPGSSLAKPSDGDAQQASFGLASAGLLPQALVPADIIRSADEAECFPFMPYSESKAPPLLLTTAHAPSQSEVGEAEEEQEDELTEPQVDPKIVEERLNRILRSYLQDGKLNGKAGVDTMEFRPSDAKKGEFDRIPF